MMFLLPQEGPQGEIGPAGPTQQVQKQEIHSLTIIPGLLIQLFQFNLFCLQPI